MVGRMHGGRGVGRAEREDSASTAHLPAATTAGMLAAWSRLMAAFMMLEKPPPRESSATARVPGCAATSVMTHSMPEMMPEYVPVPEHPSTCTGTIVAALATPYVVPPMVEAQCVPVNGMRDM